MNTKKWTKINCTGAQPKIYVMHMVGMINLISFFMEEKIKNYL